MSQPRNSPDGSALIALDPWLAPYSDRVRRRVGHYCEARDRIDRAGGLLGDISSGHLYFGFNRGENEGRQGIWYREWAPGATYVALIGEFNGWNRAADPLTRDRWGVWSIFLPDSVYADRLLHAGLVKVHVGYPGGAMDRIPAYIRRVLQSQESVEFTGQYWSPPDPYVWQYDPVPEDAVPITRGGLKVYEAHVGMAQEDLRIGTFTEFAERILPRIAALGYNAVQLMAIMEHPYYGSFGYHVSNFFAVSSRFGTPEELKALVDTAHGLGIRVIMDLVHSHAVKNLQEGLSHFDGTEHQYFHAGARGEHVAWDSLCFDYARYEVKRFLLSNVRFWLEEYHFDGFRFDGITSMLYLDHGLSRTFAGYEDYFSSNVDEDAVTYLMLANEVAHEVRADVITIAEDVSGMPGLARSVSEGGIGFDYRLAMGIPDYWVKLLKEQRDEDWPLGAIYYTLLNRRAHERHIGYVESHDQALVGDKTIAFRLMDQEMYWNMNQAGRSVIVDRGVALHKLIRLITFSLGGEGYLNFMGNEFGHPEWIDFPREGNGSSYQHARRQWSLVDDPHLRYTQLNEFDRAMLDLDRQFNLLNDPFIEQLALHEDTRQLVYRHGPLVFVFNFDPTNSYGDLRIPVPDRTDYRVVLDTDAIDFGGYGRNSPTMTYPWQDVPMYGRSQSIQLYLPARSAQVLAPA